MGVLQIDIFGSPNIGVYCIANDRFCLVPFGLTKKKMEQIQTCLSIPVYPFSVAGSNLNGALIASNSHGVAVPRTVSKEELVPLKALKDISVSVFRSRWTAIGNLVLVNDNGAIVDPRFSSRAINSLADIFDVEIVRGEISGLPYVGSLAVTTNKGVLTHPNIKEHEKKVLENILKIESTPGTINGGIPFPKLGLIANSNGLITGPSTTGFELAAITQSLKL